MELTRDKECKAARIHWEGDEDAAFRGMTLPERFRDKRAALKDKHSFPGGERRHRRSRQYMLYCRRTGGQSLNEWEGTCNSPRYLTSGSRPQSRRDLFMSARCAVPQVHRPRSHLHANACTNVCYFGYRKGQCTPNIRGGQSLTFVCLLRTVISSTPLARDEDPLPRLCMLDCRQRFSSSDDIIWIRDIARDGTPMG